MIDIRKVVVPELDQAAMTACRLRIDNLTKPIYSLAHLELIAERLAGIRQTEQPKKLNKHIIIFAADHAVDGPQNQTLGAESQAIIKRINSRRGPTGAIARSLAASMSVVDVGLERDTEDLKQIETVKICNGSHFFGFAESLEIEAMEEAMEVGYQKAEELYRQGIEVVALGNVGERAFLDARIITHILTGTSLVDMLPDTDCGPSVEERAKHLADFIARFELTKEEPLRILQCVGGYEIAAMVGFIFGAAHHHMAIVFDNAVTGAAALLAVAVNPQIKDYLFASAVYSEPIQKFQLEALGLKAYLHYEFEIDEGLGAAMGLSVLDAALHMLNDMRTFGEAAVSVAEDGPGNKRQDGR